MEESEKVKSVKGAQNRQTAAVAVTLRGVCPWLHPVMFNVWVDVTADPGLGLGSRESGLSSVHSPILPGKESQGKSPTSARF